MYIEKSQNTIGTSFRIDNTPRLKLIVLSLLFSVSPFLPSTGLAANSLSQFGITWTFDKELSTDGTGDTYQYGQFANGDYWVVGPVNITNIDPPSTFSGAREINGSMINPSPITINQGYDNDFGGGGYNRALNVAWGVSPSTPLPVPPHSSLISSISIVPSSHLHMDLETAAVLTVLDAPAPSGSFRPPYCGSDKTIKFNITDLDYSVLSKLAPVANTPSLSTWEDKFDRVWLDHVPYWNGRRYHPQQNMPDYGQYISASVGQAGLLLNLNFTDQEKETLLIRFVQVGIDNYGIVQAGGIENWWNNGGHASGRKFPILFAGAVLNDADMKAIGEKSGDYMFSGDYTNKNPPSDYVHFGEDDQTFYVSTADIELCIDPNGDWYSEENPPPGLADDAIYFLPWQWEHEGMPEWERRHVTSLRMGITGAVGYITLNWDTGYRLCCTVRTWGGQVLATHIMGLKNLWNHDVLFDYVDRYFEIEDWFEFKFVENMWRTYRDDYGCVWTRDDPTNLYSNGSNPCAGANNPIANAGTDQAVEDSDGNGSEPVTLDGTASTDPNGYIVSWIWTEDGNTIASGQIVDVIFDVGEHTVTLTVTDDDDLTDTDNVVITVTVSPVDLGKEEPGSVVQLWGKSLTFLEVNNKESETSPFAQNFTYEVYDAPNMSLLRQEAVGQDYSLDDVVASGNTEFEKMCLLGNWIRFQIPNFGGENIPSLQVDDIDPFIVWPLSRTGENFLCWSYAGTFIHSALSMGWNARWLTIKYSPDNEGSWHEVTEIWSNQYDKWIMIDPTYNIYYEKEGIPLSGYEIRMEWLKNKGADMQMRSLEHSAKPMENHTDRFFWIMVLARNNFFSQRGDVWGKSFQFKDEYNSGLSWSGHVGSVTTIINDPEELWWSLNQTTIHLYAGEQDTLLVELETFTPNFDSLWIDIDETGWQEIAESNFTWQLHEGDNKLRAKARNKFAVDGSESFISILMQPDNGLVGYWKFDDGSGSSAADSSGNSNTGTLINGPTWTTGKIDGALNFDGVDDAVQIGTGNLNISGGTIAFWAYAESFSGTAQYLFGHATQPWANRIQLYTDDSSGNLDLGLGDSHNLNSIQNLNTDTWYHITLTWNGTNYVVYIDGQARANSTYTGLSTFEGYADIGNNGNSSDRSAAFDGMIDDVRVYNRALNAAEVLELYNSAPPAFFNIQATNISSSGATIMWNTDENSTSLVQYGLDTNYGNATDLDTTLVTSHSMLLTGLASETLYHYCVRSKDESGNESISQDNTFTTSGAGTYSITASAGSGGTISPSGTTEVVSGGSQSYTITPNAGYHISDVLVDGSSVGAVGSYTFSNVTANHTIAATFAINTFSITASAGSGGTISPSGITEVVSGGSQTYTITPNTGYYIVDVLVDGNSVGAVNSYSFTNVTDDYTIVVVFDEQDETAPSVTNCSPAADAIQVPLNNLITLHIVDTGTGVDANSVTIEVNNNIVYTGNTTDYSSIYGHCRRTGTNSDYTFIYQADESFDFDQTITITVNATDLGGNVMDEHSYSFTTEMCSFGKNKKVSSGNLSKGSPATVRDSAGNIWVAWHAGPTDSRDIYVGKLTAGADNFGSSIQLTDDATDQCNADIAVDADGKLYIVWQDNRRGNWDIYVSTSLDGTNWSAERMVTDSNDNEINPAIAIDSSNKAYIVWEDDRNSNKDIYIASSSSGFASKEISQITSNASDQIAPAIAVDSGDTVYVVWTSSNNIYGAASNAPWTNVPIVSNGNNQSSPAIATESSGAILHLLWVDDASGNNDIYYASSNGLPGSPLTGNTIIDDTSSTEQLEPSIAVIGSTGNSLKVFACWQDNRNADTDLYFVEVSSDSRTNVLVSDDSTNTNQSEPAMGIDVDGYPYLVWTDNRNTNTDIYYAGSTFIESDALASEDVSASSTETTIVGAEFISSVDDVRIEVPVGAYSCDITITISKIKNPPAFTMQCLGGYDFGPSGIEFSQPVTITIPYNYTGSEDSALAYWYNSLTEALSQNGITDVETIEISPTLHALRFKTTHFTPFYIFLGSAGAVAGGSGGGGGGGGCSISRSSQGSVTEFLLPYIGLAVVMIILKQRDARNRKSRSTT